MAVGGGGGGISRGGECGGGGSVPIEEGVVSNRERSKILAFCFVLLMGMDGALLVDDGGRKWKELEERELELELE